MCSFQTGTHLHAGWGADTGFCSPDAARGQDSCAGETPAHLAPTAPMLLLPGSHHPLLQHCSGGMGSNNAATSRWSQRRGTRPPACPWTCPAAAWSCAAPCAMPAAACRHAGSGSGSGSGTMGPWSCSGQCPAVPWCLTALPAPQVGAEGRANTERHGQAAGTAPERQRRPGP